MGPLDVPCTTRRTWLTCRSFRHDGDVPDDAVFLALAHPVRRRLLQILAEGPRVAGDLADQFDLSRPAVAEHLQVLVLPSLAEVATTTPA